MVNLYYYIPIEQAGHIVECGLKLSRWFDREEFIEGQYEKCMSALLNPKDDTEKYYSNHLVCINIEVQPNYCFIGDKYLYNSGLEHSDIMSMYRESIVPVKKYVFGTYRLPECLVTSTVIGGNISILNKSLDLPVLYENSEKLYINNTIEFYKDEYDEFNNDALYYLHLKLVEAGKFSKIEDCKNNTTIFIENSSKKPFIFTNPDLSAY